MMDIPPVARDVSASQKSRRVTGSTPVVGSSKSSSAGSIGADQSEDLSSAHFETDLIESLDRTVAFGERVCFDDCLFGHHGLPIEINPSAGMPGFAKPPPPRNPSFTPITCFTRSSLK